MVNLKLQNAVEDFQRSYLRNGEIADQQVVALLDLFKEELDLAMIYVCENAAEGKQFLYQYCSSGDKQIAMHRGLLIDENNEFDRLKEAVNKENPLVLTNELATGDFTLESGNLIYAFVSVGLLQGIVSFEAKEKSHAWSQEEKESQAVLARILWPLICSDQVKAQSRILNAKVKGSSLAWIYPKAKTVIFSKNLRDDFGLNKCYRLKSAADFCQNFIAYYEQEKVLLAYREAVEKGTARVACHAFQDPDKFEVSFFVNRRGVKGEAEQVVAILEKVQPSSTEQQERTLRLEAYREFQGVFSRDNLFELFIDLEKKQATIFKAPLAWQKGLNQEVDFDQLMRLFAIDQVLPGSQQQFVNSINVDHIKQTLQKKRNTFLTAHVNVDGKKRLLEFEVIQGQAGNYEEPQTAIMVAKDVTDKVSRYDSLTGLLNMHHFLLESRQRQEPQGQLLVMNIDNFKLYNMQHGLEQGDQCLVKIADLLKGLYPNATLGRFSSDNFYVYDPEPGDWKLKLIKLQERLKKEALTSPIWIRAGIYNYDEPISVALACDRAKIACDRAKEFAEQAWCLYTPKMQEQEELKQYLINHLDEAIERHYLQVYYQPVIRTLTGRLCSAEALIRWIYPDKGMLSPGDFIPLFEEKNLSYKVDRYVIQEVTKLLRDRIENGQTVVPVSINFSRADFQMMNPLEELNQAIRKNHLRRSLIHVEITESALAKDVEGLKNSIHDFRQAGYQVWMDDFGSGYSSLNYLKNFEFDEIKLDMIFMRNFDEASKTILKACVRMAKALGIHTLAEGVENKEQLDFLREIGCERIQGFYYSRPLPSNDFFKMVAEKGIEAEEREQSKFYPEVGLVDLAGDQPLGLLFDDGQKFKRIFVNAEFQKEIDRSPEIYERLFQEGNDLKSSFGQKFRELAERARQGESSLADIQQKGQFLRLQVDSIAKGDFGQMLQINAWDITAQF